MNCAAAGAESVTTQSSVNPDRTQMRGLTLRLTPLAVGEWWAVSGSAAALSAYPLLGEAYTFGEGVIPILGERGLLAAPGPRTS